MRYYLSENAAVETTLAMLETLTGSPGTAESMVESAQAVGWATVTYTTCEYRVTYLMCESKPYDPRFAVECSHHVHAHPADDGHL